MPEPREDVAPECVGSKQMLGARSRLKVGEVDGVRIERYKQRTEECETPDGEQDESAHEEGGMEEEPGAGSLFP